MNTEIEIKNKVLKKFAILTNSVLNANFLNKLDLFLINSNLDEKQQEDLILLIIDICNRALWDAAQTLT
jgi:50S ribosomal subunit-associated GTPase HflX